MQIKDVIPWASKDEPAHAKEEDEHPIAALQRDMNRVFDGFWHRFERPFGALDTAWTGANARSDVVETDGGIEVSVELPGMDQSDIDVSLTGDALTIKGEKKIEREEEKKGYYVSERSYGSIHRAIPLPPGIDTEKAEATFKNGVLTVRLPQNPEAKADVKHVDIRSD